MERDEGLALYDAARACAALGPCLEIGSYCGKSTVYLGAGCREAGGVLYALDHHRGSEEHQIGEEYHDPDLVDPASGRFDSFAAFRRAIEEADLVDTVVPLVAPSRLAARAWATPLGMVFIDGGHSREAADADYEGWAGHVVPGGLLAIHDVFPDPADGGRPPFEIYERALASGRFEESGAVLSLRLLRRLDRPVES